MLERLRWVKWGGGVLSALGALGAAAAPGLPDTGVTAHQCFRAGSSDLVNCRSEAAQALSSSQDGMTGRDVRQPAAVNGKLGFNYTKIAMDGTRLPVDADQWDCVRDNTTGLLWEIKTADGGLRGRDQTYTNWGDGRLGDASAYVLAVNIAGLCGRHDWRQPTGLELQGLVDYGVDAFVRPDVPLIETRFFPNIRRGGYWAAPIGGFAGGAWVVSFAYGSGFLTSRHIRQSVQLVAGRPTMAGVRYRYSADGTEVTDGWTGLVWRRCSEGQIWDGQTCSGTASVFSHEQALAYSQTQTGWRLPNIKELASLLRLKNAREPLIDPVAFPGAPTEYHWSSSPTHWSGAWGVGFLYGGWVNSAHRVNLNRIRLVRQE